MRNIIILLNKSKLQDTSWLFFSIISLIFLLFLNSTTPCNLLQNNFLDPYVYTGYIHNYQDLIERYGRTYYSCRLAFIYPARVLVSIFGSEFGYLIFRNILLVGAMGAIWRISFYFYGSKKFAAFLTWLILLHPWLLRSLFWDYVDGAAVVYILIAASFFLTAAEKARLSYFLSGVFFILAANCNLFSAGIFIALIPSMILLSREKQFKLLLRKGLFFFGGAVIVYLSLIGITYLEFPKKSPFFDAATLDVSQFLLSGGGKVWVHTISNLISEGNYYIFYPLYIFLIGLIFWNLRVARGGFLQLDLGKAAILYLFIILLIYSVFHFFLGICVISNFYYFSYTLPAIIFAFIWLIGESVFSLDSKTQNVFFICASLIFGCMWLLGPSLALILNAISGGYCILAIACLMLLILGLTRYKKLQTSLILTSFILSPLIFYRSKEYSPLYENIAQEEWDLYHGAIYLQKIITETLPPSLGKVGFWYSNKKDHMYFNSLQSMFLWGYSRLASTDPKVSDGMPVIDDVFRKGINNYKFITLLGINENEINEGYESLIKEGIPIKVILKQEYHSDHINYHLLIVKKE